VLLLVCDRRMAFTLVILEDVVVFILVLVVILLTGHFVLSSIGNSLCLLFSDALNLVLGVFPQNFSSLANQSHQSVSPYITVTQYAAAQWIACQTSKFRNMGQDITALALVLGYIA
jgi:hypothetical protein